MLDTLGARVATADDALTWASLATPEPSPPDVERARAALDRDDVLAVLVEDARDEAVARVWGRISGSEATLWVPRVRQSAAAQASVALARGLTLFTELAPQRDVDRCEARVVPDDPHADIWTDVLAACGYALIGAARLHELAAVAAAGDPPARSVAISTIGTDQTRHLEAVVEAARRESSDASLRAAAAEGGAEGLARLAHLGSYEVVDECWRTVVVDGLPRAYALCSRSPDGAGWVLEVGTDPAYRHQGLARAVLADAISIAAGNGISPMRAVIDVSNVESERLHESLGFAPLGEAAEVWQRQLHALGG